MTPKPTFRLMTAAFTIAITACKKEPSAWPPMIAATGQDGRARSSSAFVPRRRSYEAAKSGLVYTRGDEIGAVDGKAVVAFLAPIETPEEAASTQLT